MVDTPVLPFSRRDRVSRSHGHCIYIVRFVREGEASRMVRADVNRDYEQYQHTDDGEDARLIPRLIDIILLGREW